MVDTLDHLYTCDCDCENMHLCILIWQTFLHYYFDDISETPSLL